MQHWATQIDSTTEAFAAQFGQLTEQQLNWKPDPKTWSIGQNIDHLIVINATYYPIVPKIRSGQYRLSWLAKLDFLVNFLGKMILQAVQPDRRRKMKTFPIWEPSTSQIPAAIVRQFQQSQTELKEFIAGTKDLVKKGTVIASPANRNIFYKLEMAFDIIVAHERRHLEQAKEVLQWMNNPYS